MENETTSADERAVVIARDGQGLIDLVPVDPEHVASRRVLKAAGIGLVRLTLDGGQSLEEHQAAVPVLIHLLSGEAEVEVDGTSTPLAAGGLLYLAAGVRHAVRASTRADLLLTLADARAPRARAAEDEAAESAVDSGRSMASGHLVLASSAADSVILEAITQRHADISGALAAHVSRLLGVAGSGEDAALEDARNQLVDWARAELVPLFAAEADILYPEVPHAAPEKAGLAQALREGRERIDSLVEEARGRTDPALLAASVVALRVAVGHQLTTESERLLPALAASTQHSLSEQWAGVERAAPRADLRSVPGDATDAGVVDPTGAVCECGVAEDSELPELDVRSVPHAIRHATVFGALDSLRPREGLVLIASHDPLPLLAQLRARTGDRFAISYLQRGPEDWRLQLVYDGPDAATR